MKASISAAAIAKGLITYMRTDSLTLSSRALAEAENFIREQFGDKYYEKARFYTTKSKNAQEAHEAIRPTHLGKSPEALRSVLDGDELALYRLIWNRTLASQMTDAQMLRTSVEIDAKTKDGPVVLRANGSVVKFPGYLKVADVQQKDTQLPPLEQGEKVNDNALSVSNSGLHLVEMDPQEHFTQPPARFTEALTRQEARRAGHRSPVHLRAHHFDDSGARVRRTQREGPGTDLRRRCRHQTAARTLRRVCRSGIHRTHGGRSRRHFER